MSYDSNETSVELGRPVELFLFQNAVDEYAYTSTGLPVTFDARTYDPRSIYRSEPQINSGEVEVERAIEVTLPADDPLPRRYVSSLPASDFQLTIYRQHASDGPTPETIVFFRGRVASVAFSGAEAKMKIEPGTAIFSKTIPKKTYRGLCNHVLYDGGCKISDTDPAFSKLVEVTAISASRTLLTVTASGLGAVLGGDPNFFDAGFLRQADLDHRMVLDVSNVVGDLADVLILLPFEALQVGEELRMNAGCAHDLVTCNAKFDNVVNYGGFPWVPTRNPFETGIVL